MVPNSRGDLSVTIPYCYELVTCMHVKQLIAVSNNTEHRHSWINTSRSVERQRETMTSYTNYTAKYHNLTILTIWKLL